MTHDFIIDFETFGKDAQKCAVIDCSVMVFSWDKMISDDPYTLADISKTKRFKLSVVDQVKNYGWEIDKGTVFEVRDVREHRNRGSRFSIPRISPSYSIAFGSLGQGVIRTITCSYTGSSRPFSDRKLKSILSTLFEIK